MERNDRWQVGCGCRSETDDSEALATAQTLIEQSSQADHEAEPQEPAAHAARP